MLFAHKVTEGEAKRSAEFYLWGNFKIKDKDKLQAQPAAGHKAGRNESAQRGPDCQRCSTTFYTPTWRWKRRGKARGNPNPGLPCPAGRVAERGRLGWVCKELRCSQETQQCGGAAGGAPGTAPGALSQLPGWSWKEDQLSFPATIFQVRGDCRRGREERGAGFVCLAQSYALKQITENAAEGSSKAEFSTDKSRGRPSPISDAGHVFAFPFPTLASPINH